MWLFSTSLYVTQVLPPSWRKTFKETVIQSMAIPLQYVYKQVYEARTQLPKQMNLNAQVGVLEAFLNQQFASARYRHIEILETTTGGEIKVLITKSFWNKKDVMEQEIRKVLPFGSRLIIEKKE